MVGKSCETFTEGSDVTDGLRLEGARALGSDDQATAATLARQGVVVVHARDVIHDGHVVGVLYGLRRDQRMSAQATEYALRWVDRDRMDPRGVDADGVDNQRFDALGQVREYLARVSVRFRR